MNKGLNLGKKNLKYPWEAIRWADSDEFSQTLKEEIILTFCSSYLKIEEGTLFNSVYVVNVAIILKPVIPRKKKCKPIVLKTSHTGRHTHTHTYTTAHTLRQGASYLTPETHERKGFGPKLGRRGWFRSRDPLLVILYMKQQAKEERIWCCFQRWTSGFRQNSASIQEKSSFPCQWASLSN